MSYKKIIIVIGAIILSSLVDIFLWFKGYNRIKVLYLDNDNIRYKIQILNDTLKLFWQIFPFVLFFVALIIRKSFYKKVSINNLIHFLCIVILVLILKFATGRARPQSATSPFDYDIFKGYIIKNRDSFPSGEVAITFVQLLYLVGFVRFKLFLTLFSILTPVFRLLLYRHWWFDCVASILLSAIIIKFSEIIRKKYDYNKKAYEERV